MNISKAMIHLMFVVAASLALAAISCNEVDKSSFSELYAQPAYKSVSDSIRQSPNDARLYFRRAVLLNTGQHVQPALLDFRKAWSIDPQESYAVGIANILIETKPDSAILFLQEARRQLPASMYLSLLLAKTYDSRQQYDQALALCDSILNVEPVQVNTLVLKADILEKKQDFKAMITALERAYSVLPGNMELVDRLMLQYAESKNDKVIALADSVIAIDRQRLYTAPFYVKGVYYVNTGQKDRALQEFDNAIRHDHRYLNAYIEKGKIQFDERRTKEAMATFELANRVNPAFPDAWYWMGRCNELLGFREDAKLNYEKAYALDKSFTEAKEAAARL